MKLPTNRNLHCVFEPVSLPIAKFGVVEVYLWQYPVNSAYKPATNYYHLVSSCTCLAEPSRHLALYR